MNRQTAQQMDGRHYDDNTFWPKFGHGVQILIYSYLFRVNTRKVIVNLFSRETFKGNNMGEGGGRAWTHNKESGTLPKECLCKT